MTDFISKIGKTLSLLLVSSLGLINAEDDRSFSLEDCSICQPCCETPSCWGEGFISAELLYWRAFQGGIEGCIPTYNHDSVTSSGKVVSKFNAKGFEPNFDWNPGFRVGAGYEFYCSNWGIAAFWTHYDAQTHRHARCGNYIHWNLDFDRVDLVAGYAFDLGCAVALTPFFGLTGGRVDQRIKLKKEGCSRSDESFVAFLDQRNHNKENFLGLGPLIGLEADWAILNNFSLFARGAFSWLYGKFHVRNHEVDKFESAYQYQRIHSHFDACIALVDFGIGLRWETSFCNDNHLFLELGLEHQQYFNFNRMGCCGDLCFDGLNVGLGFEF